MNKKIIIHKKAAFIILFFLGFNNLVQSQQSNDFWNHVRFGGGIGLGFGDGFFSGTLAPSAIYEFNETVALGLGLNGTINNRKGFYKSTIYGGSLIGLVNVIPQLQFSSEFEKLRVNRKYDASFNLPDDNYWSPALFLGLGYRNGNVTFGIRYDVLYDEKKSIYADPWMPFVRFYF
ncbi:alpha-ketoglutarate decarboxylase [Confluentibacter flavum]|uniref:Alpha-ketoglutarate decarboxylase n=1 Tax=Confluentibacter flavum TaxID=1909700 RepID=A0A2N3HID4_9FLAO|nr:alpha-ketoglutarate decarboxylase [Confluentibacter flavum]PKQ44716.1 alpha-ketoglutarate decarboxylase [Confluentibacter flavum]